MRKIIICAFIGIMFMFVGCSKAENLKAEDPNASIYQEGRSYEDAGEYNLALSKYEECSDYDDALERQKYVSAIIEMSDGNLHNAEDLLNGLTDEFKNNNSDVEEYLTLISKAEELGYAGLWNPDISKGNTLPMVYICKIIIKDKEYYIKLGSVTKSELSSGDFKWWNEGIGKIESNVITAVVTKADKNYETTVKFISNDSCEIERLPYKKEVDYSEINDVDEWWEVL